jgi:hypothetical protein
MGTGLAAARGTHESDAVLVAPTGDVRNGFQKGAGDFEALGEPAEPLMRRSTDSFFEEGDQGWPGELVRC